MALCHVQGPCCLQVNLCHPTEQGGSCHCKLSWSLSLFLSLPSMLVPAPALLLASMFNGLLFIIFINIGAGRCGVIGRCGNIGRCGFIGRRAVIGRAAILLRFLIEMCGNPVSYTHLRAHETLRVGRMASWA